MTDFNEKQLKELAASAIDRELAEIHIVPLEGDAALQALYYALPPEERRNDGRISDKWLKRGEHIRKHGGLAFYAADPITGERTECISFKPNQPSSPDRKYEQPPKSKNQAFYPAIGKDFWKWTFENDLPIIITEGCKKALSAMSHGFPCVALTGIWNGVTAHRDENGKVESYDLIPSLKYLAGRKIYIAFDRDKAAKTIKNVIHARSVLANKLIENGCECYSMRWDSDDGKGIDDLIVSGGVPALEKSIAEAEKLTGEAPNLKKPASATILAEQIAKEWKGRVHYYLPTKLWRVYRHGIWESLDNETMETKVYHRIIEDAPDLNSHNYIITILKFVRAWLMVEK